jgi:uncharacterized protein (TIGR03086 family)
MSLRGGYGLNHMPENLEPPAAQLAALVIGVTDDQLALPTPCPDYQVGDLLDHIATLSRAFTFCAEKDLVALADRPGLGNSARLADDWRAQISHDLGGMARAWSDPAAWEGMTRIGGGDQPGSVAGMIGLEELVVHGWDIARSTGQEFSADPATLDGALAALQLFQQPGVEPAPGSPFGPAIDVPEDAARLDQVIALSGRNPHWSPDTESA